VRAAPISPKSAPVGGRNAGDGVFVGQQRDDASLPEFDIRLPDIALERVDDVGGLIRLWEHPRAPLGLERHAAFLKEAHDLLRGKGVEGAVEKTRIAPHRLQKAVAVAVVGEVAAALAGDEQLAPDAGVAIEKQHARAARRGLSRRHEPGGAGADRDEVVGSHARSPLSSDLV
jgi:hypothetical protein